MLNRFAYHFRYLKVDVGSGASKGISIPDDILQETIGGAGLGVHLLLATESAEADPLSPDSSLFFVFSPLVGSPLTTSAKFAVVSKSPLTQRINDSLAGSRFAIAGKQTGFDAIQIVGKAAVPSLLIIDNETVRLEECPDLWGRSIPETEAEIQKKWSKKFQVAAIGPAGERLVRFATICHSGRHAGRGGSGAVLGSKNIKAVLVRGDQQVDWARPSDLQQLSKSLSQKSFGPATEKYRELGTAGNLLTFNRLNCLPSKNFQQSSLAEVEKLSPESLVQDRLKVRQSCAACTIGCEHLYSRRDAKSGTEGADKKVRLEYESLYALGPMCGITHPDTVLAAAEYCDDQGLDTISAGATIAFAMDCFEKGWSQSKMEFGNGNDLLRALRNIVERRDEGDWLAEGSRRWAENLGGESIGYAPHVKGLEIPGYDPRRLPAMALGFAVGARGADHNKSSAYEIDFSTDHQNGVFAEDRIEELIRLEDRSAVMDSLIFCKFLRGVFKDFFSESAEILQLTTGWDWDASKVESAGKQLVENKKRFNIRAGWSPAEDQLPTYLHQKMADSSQALFTADELSRAIESYNRLRGWSSSGYPQTDERPATEPDTIC